MPGDPLVRMSRLTTTPSTAAAEAGDAVPEGTDDDAKPNPTNEAVRTSPGLAGFSLETRLPSGRATSGWQAWGILRLAAASQEFKI